MANPSGPLGPADERFDHQLADTFATVGTSDPSWTEKVCAMAAAKDGSLQLGFGLGKYPNRNVMDGYAGISRGVEQMTVRASRRLSPDPEATVIGPIRYGPNIIGPSSYGPKIIGPSISGPTINAYHSYHMWFVSDRWRGRSRR